MVHPNQFSLLAFYVRTQQAHMARAKEPNQSRISRPSSNIHYLTRGRQPTSKKTQQTNGNDGHSQKHTNGNEAGFHVPFVLFK